MFFTVLTSVLLTLWVLLCSGLFLYKYLVEVVLDVPVTGQSHSPSSAHIALKTLIERLVQDASTFPKLNEGEESPDIPGDQLTRSYEDLLATAIINKVISNSQNHHPPSSAASVSSRISTPSRNRGEKEYFFGEETLESKWKTTDLETTSVSSVEEWLCSDSSFGSKKYVDRITLTIKQDIEEISQTDSDIEEEEDDNEYFRSKSSLLSDDEPNWFLQKRQFQGTHSPVPVPMLVPKPVTDAKVLIGDKIVDETSDLSDVASDYEETETIPSRHSILIESKTIIGGKNPRQNGSDGESSADSGVKEVDPDKSGYDDPVSEDGEKSSYPDSAYISKADITVDDDNIEDASILSVYSNTEQEAEYTEKYASLPRTILKTPTPPSRPSLQKPEIPESTKVSNKEGTPKTNESTDDGVEEDEDRDLYTFAGSYSTREKEKWKHAVEMKHNPYSKENIERRIKRTRSAISSLFGPDYYARQASSPSGGGKLKSPEQARDQMWPPLKPHDKESKLIIKPVPYERGLDDLFDEPHQTRSIQPAIRTQHKKEETSEETVVTSDSDLSYINFYDVEKSEVYKKTKAELFKENSHVAGKDIYLEDAEAKIEIVPKEHPERPRYLKLNSTTSPTRYLKTGNESNLRRHKSESDLLEDSLDTLPKVISRKKDNTLISKIYSHPHVRNFALSSRNQLPIDYAPVTPTFATQRSFTEITRYNGKTPVYNSDDGTVLSHNSKKSVYSSEEDLIDSEKGGEKTSKVYDINTRNYKHRNTLSISSEDDVLSEHLTSIGYKPTNSSYHIYSSSEDLLSSDDHERPPRKKDNTLIEKIYQDPNVRNFGLLSRDYIPIPEEHHQHQKKIYSSEDEQSDESSKLRKRQSSSVTSIQSAVSDEIIRIEKSIELQSNLNEKDNLKVLKNPLRPQHENNLVHHVSGQAPKQDGYERSAVSPDPDVDEIAKKHIVHHILEQIGKPKPKPAARTKFAKDKQEIISIEEDNIGISVKELKKKFETNEKRSKVVSSLTARSLSKHMRENLKN